MVEEVMDWRQAAPHFEPDGALRDIYVFGTDLLDWQRVWDALRTWDPLPDLTIAAQPATMPDKVQDIFNVVQERGARLSVNVSGAVLNCFFFGDDEIEFDLDPNEVAGPAQLEGLARFMSLLGRATGKPVVMTMENVREAVFLRYEPDAQRVEWVGPADE
jgi:hypothetical protein